MENSSDSSKTNSDTKLGEKISSERAPAARALVDLRAKVLSSTTGSGGITKVSQEVGIARSVLSRVLAPGVIRKIAEVERHLNVKSE